MDFYQIELPEVSDFPSIFIMLKTFVATIFSNGIDQCCDEEFSKMISCGNKSMYAHHGARLVEVATRR